MISCIFLLDFSASINDELFVNAEFLIHDGSLTKVGSIKWGKLNLVPYYVTLFVM